MSAAVQKTGQVKLTATITFDMKIMGCIAMTAQEKCTEQEVLQDKALNDKQMMDHWQKQISRWCVMVMAQLPKAGGFNATGCNYQIRRYTQDGVPFGVIPHPPNCKNTTTSLNLLVVENLGRFNDLLIVSSYESRCIWTLQLNVAPRSWFLAWKASETTQEERGHESPITMCSGKPGQIIVATGNYEYPATWGVSVFNVVFDKILCKVKELAIAKRIKMNVQAGYICYFDIPGKGEAVAVTSVYPDVYSLCVYELTTGSCLWTRGISQMGKWSPWGVCSDNKGQLYVSDNSQSNKRIVVFAAENGQFLQTSNDYFLGQPKHLWWSKETESLIVHHMKGDKFPYEQHITCYHVEV